MACDREFRIRDAEESDCASVCTLIAELASYEEMSHLNNMSEQKLINDAFGEGTPWYSALIAEVKTNEVWNAVGYALFQIGFSLRFLSNSIFQSFL